MHFRLVQGVLRLPRSPRHGLGGVERAWQEIAQVLLRAAHPQLSAAHLRLRLKRRLLRLEVVTGTEEKNLTSDYRGYIRTWRSPNSATLLLRFSLNLSVFLLRHCPLGQQSPFLARQCYCDRNIEVAKLTAP